MHRPNNDTHDLRSQAPTPPPAGDFQKYTQLKREFTEGKNLSQREFERACRLAAKLAGI